MKRLAWALLALVGCDGVRSAPDQAQAAEPPPVVRLAKDGLYRKEVAFDGVNETGAEWICIKGGYRAGYDPLENALDLPNCQVSRRGDPRGFQFDAVCDTENQAGEKRNGRLTATADGVDIHTVTPTGTMDIGLKFERACPPDTEAQDVLDANGVLARGDGP